MNGSAGETGGRETRAVDPAILYLGTPVVLIGTQNEDGMPNLAPMSSAWWLGWGCMLGLNASSKTLENLQRTGQCVLNMPSADLVACVDRIALTTGSNPVPANKVGMGFRYVADKFGLAQLTPAAGDTVMAPRAIECPVQMEAVVEQITPFGATNPRIRTKMLAIEVRITRVHAHPDILVDGNPNRIDPDKWRPLIMSFREFYGLGGRVHQSRLAGFPEDKFRPPAQPYSANQQPLQLAEPLK
ncbi:flavin reductase family protein [Bradyrhizobium erythrophlei]|uniref:flavin reductase family protein n=1 Tax=Bradyrhizobium erythrophlei TaxID=1437360 RepID=UPI0035E6E517